MALLAVCLAALVGAEAKRQDGSGDRTAIPRQQSSGPPTFYKEVLPILQKHCQDCHRAGGIAPMGFETYDETQGYAAAIRAAAEDKSMPPWFADPQVGKFSNDLSLSSGQIATLVAWVDAKAPAGDPHDAPPSVLWSESWSIPKPDLVLKMPQSVPLPASGDIEYTYEIVPTHFTEGRWVRMAEVLPSLRANVHHAVVYIRPPDSNWLRRAPIGVPFTASTLADPEDRRNSHWTDSDILLVYAPGSGPDKWPETMAKFIPAGSDLVFQMHYTSNGHAGTDQTSVGMIFSKTPPPHPAGPLESPGPLRCHFHCPPEKIPPSSLSRAPPPPDDEMPHPRPAPPCSDILRERHARRPRADLGSSSSERNPLHAPAVVVA